MNSELKKVCNWLLANKLSLNLDKTHFMLFSPRQKNVDHLNFNIYLNDSPIQQVETTKFLGVIIHRNLVWNKHIDQICNKISKSTAIIRKACPVLSQNSLKMLYSTLVLPYLNYCSLVWGHTTAENLERILLIQKKIVRYITNSDYLAHTALLFSKLKVLTIHKLIDYRLDLLMYRFFNNLAPSFYLDNNFFQYNDTLHAHNTRQKSEFHIDFTRTVLAKNTLRFMGPLAFNSLPDEIKLTGSLSRFKFTCFDYLLKN